MYRKISRLHCIFLVVVFSMFFLSIVYCVQSPTSELVQSELDTQTQVSESNFDVTVWVFPAARYEFFDVNIRNEVVVNITMRLTDLPIALHEIRIVLSFSVTKVTNLPRGATYDYGLWGHVVPVGILSIYLPANISETSIGLRGYISGSSVLWKNTMEVFFLNVTSSPVRYTPSYTLVVAQPLASKVLKVYAHSYPNLRYQEADVGEQRRIVISESHPASPVVILYQHENWEIYAVIVMTIMVFTFFAIPYMSKFARAQKTNAKLTKLIATFRKSIPVKLKMFLKQSYNRISKIDSSKLLTGYILCAILIVALSFAVGPDPRLKVYVLASTPETAKTISDFVYKQGDAVAITIYDAMGQFETLTDFGVFSAAIIGDFVAFRQYVSRYIYPGLDSVPQIVILEDRASGAFLLEIQERYPDKTIVVKNLAALSPILYRMPRRTNTLGLSVSPAMYITVSTFVGLCSFILVFFGLAFLASRLIEVGKKPGLGGFPEAIAYSVFVFVLSQIIYIVASVLLAMPLGLHASTSKVTVVGFLGFGGGSKPRMFAGLAGFLFGSFLSMKGGLKPNITGFLSFLVVGFFILLDPFTGGIIFYEFVILFTVGPTMENAYITNSYIRGFLGTIAQAFGAWVSPTYGISTGIMLYYAGAISFCLFAKLKKSTATVLLLFSAFCVSDGGLRVGDMRPWKAFASVVPGVMAGLVAVLIFGLLNLFEAVIRDRIGAGAKFA